MADPKGDRLWVNVSAAQARRRLKGFGHGVRKIQSAGRNQALIIHTATERHLEELEGQFADVGCAGSEAALSEPIDNLRNIGPDAANRLRRAGIRTIADLRRLGPVLAFQMVRQQQPGVRLDLLWAIAAGLQGDDWRSLSEEEKERLREHLRAR